MVSYNARVLDIDIGVVAILNYSCFCHHVLLLFSLRSCMAVVCLLSIDVESKDRRRKHGGREKGTIWPGQRGRIIAICYCCCCCHGHLVLLSSPSCIVVVGAVITILYCHQWYTLKLLYPQSLRYCGIAVSSVLAVAAFIFFS